MMYLPYIITGFVSLLASDLLQIRRRKFESISTLAVGYGVLTSSAVFVLATHKVILPPGLFRDGLSLLSCIGIALLLYSTVLEIPIRSRAGRSVPVPPEASRVALTSGTYGIVRHPGFLWMILATVPLILVYHDREVSIALSTMNLCNLLLVTAEDAFVFPRVFINYSSYKQEVPFLLPRRIRGRKNPYN